MTPTYFTILSNERKAEHVYRLHLQGSTDGIRPGQFVYILLDGYYLPRPLSVVDVADTRLTLIYKVAGEGMQSLRSTRTGKTLQVLAGLGTGWDLTRAGERPLLIGGGTGVAALYLLARRLRAKRLPVRVLLGFKSKKNVFYERHFRDMGCNVTTYTEDGTYGIKGLVTDGLNGHQSFYYAAGPMPMIKAVVEKAGTEGEVSLETRLGCGVGMCHGCSIETTDGMKTICHDGPVFDVAKVKDSL